MLLLEQGKAYGFQEFSLNLLDYLYEHRDEVKFDDIKDLSDQIVRDCKEAKAFHEKVLATGVCL